MDTEASSSLAILRFSPDFDDALAFERLSRRTDGRRRAALVLFCAAFGLVAGLLADIWTLWLQLSLATLACGIAMSVRALRQRRRARGRVAAARDSVLLDHGDHLEHRVGAHRIFVAPELVHAVVVEDRRLHVVYEGGSIVIPLRAFADETDMRAFAACLDARSRASADRPSKPSPSARGGGRAPTDRTEFP